MGFCVRPWADPAAKEEDSQYTSSGPNHLRCTTYRRISQSLALPVLFASTIDDWSLGWHWFRSGAVD